VTRIQKIIQFNNSGIILVFGIKIRVDWISLYQYYMLLLFNAVTTLYQVDLIVDD